MTFYKALVSEATGVTDPALLDAIEDCMRHDVFHSTLDWQTKEQLVAGAKLAHETVVSTGFADP